MKHPAPRTGRDASPLWQFARERRLSVPRCPKCHSFQWPPRSRCPKCLADTVWQDVSGRGEIVSFSVVHRAVNPDLADEVPYTVAIVELDEGVRLLTNIVCDDPDRLRCGRRVEVRFEATADPEMWVPVFSPVREGTSDA